jgi:hypothetical protein
VDHQWTFGSKIADMAKKTLPWFVLGAVLFCMAAGLRLQGRLWTCSCGYVLAWAGDVNSPDNSQHLFDPYTFTHLIHGFIFIGLVQLLWPRLAASWKLVAALSVEALWEVIENTSFVIDRYRSETISLGYTGDTVLNSFGDLAACALGVFLARKLGVIRTIVLAGIIELVLLLTIRDSLLLNIIMLIHPSDAIRAWQAGQ